MVRHNTLVSSPKDLYCNSNYTEAITKICAVISPLPVQYGAHEMSSLGATLCATHFIGCQFFRGQNLAEIA